MDNQVNSVALKLPTFWPEQAQVWFLQAEAQFNLRNITVDSTKFYHVIAALDQSTAGRVVDLLSNPPAEDRYKTLKDRLTATFGLGRRERASRLLHMRGLGDRKPSQLMDEMLALLDGHTSCFLFEQIFLEQLPEDIRLQLANADFSNLRAVALLADTLWLARDQHDTAVAVNRVSMAPKWPKKSSPAPIQPIDKTGLCFYHARFGNKAHKCITPCTFSGNAMADRR